MTFADFDSYSDSKKPVLERIEILFGRLKRWDRTLVAILATSVVIPLVTGLGTQLELCVSDKEDMCRVWPNRRDDEFGYYAIGRVVTVSILIACFLTVYASSVFRLEKAIKKAGNDAPKDMPIPVSPIRKLHWAILLAFAFFLAVAFDVPEFLLAGEIFQMSLMFFVFAAIFSAFTIKYFSFRGWCSVLSNSVLVFIALSFFLMPAKDSIAADVSPTAMVSGQWEISTRSWNPEAVHYVGSVVFAMITDPNGKREMCGFLEPSNTQASKKQAMEIDPKWHTRVPIQGTRGVGQTNCLSDDIARGRPVVLWGFHEDPSNSDEWFGGRKKPGRVLDKEPKGGSGKDGKYTNDPLAGQIIELRLKCDDATNCVVYHTGFNVEIKFKKKP